MIPIVACAHTTCIATLFPQPIQTVKIAHGDLHGRGRHQPSRQPGSPCTFHTRANLSRSTPRLCTMTGKVISSVSVMSIAFALPSMLCAGPSSNEPWYLRTFALAAVNPRTQAAAAASTDQGKISPSATNPRIGYGPSHALGLRTGRRNITHWPRAATIASRSNLRRRPSGHVRIGVPLLPCQRLANGTENGHREKLSLS